MKLNTIKISLIAATFFMAACGQAPEKSEEATTESTEMESQEGHDDHEGHNHDEMAEESNGSDLLAVPDSAKVFFEDAKANLMIDPETGNETVSYEFKFGVEGMEVEPAGELNQGKGHHHIIIDGEALEAGVVVPADSMNIHYGKGQTEATIVLPNTGKRTFTMQFADGYHRSYGKQLSATITLGEE